MTLLQYKKKKRKGEKTMREINNEVITVQDCIDLKELKNVTIEINNGKITGMIDGENENSSKS